MLSIIINKKDWVLAAAKPLIHQPFLYIFTYIQYLSCRCFPVIRLTLQAVLLVLSLRLSCF